MSRRGGKTIYILCEGSTEENAVNLFIKKHWDVSSVGLKAVQTTADDIIEDADIAIDNGDAQAVFSLFDLYGFKHELRDSQGFKKDYLALTTRKDQIKFCVDYYRRHLKEQVSNKEEFHPHFSIHEIEAWILADTTSVSRKLKICNYKGEANPEEINFDNPPKKRLNNLFSTHLKTRYKENSDSKNIFPKLDFNTVYSKCHYFKLFYDELVREGQRILST